MSHEALTIGSQFLNEFIVDSSSVFPKALRFSRLPWRHLLPVKCLFARRTPKTETSWKSKRCAPGDHSEPFNKSSSVSVDNTRVPDLSQRFPISNHARRSNCKTAVLKFCTSAKPWLHRHTSDIRGRNSEVDFHDQLIGSLVGSLRSFSIVVLERAHCFDLSFCARPAQDT